jgi:hypothetical protein
MFLCRRRRRGGDNDSRCRLTLEEGGKNRDTQYYIQKLKQGRLSFTEDDMTSLSNSAKISMYHIRTRFRGRRTTPATDAATNPVTRASAKSGNLKLAMSQSCAQRKRKEYYDPTGDAREEESCFRPSRSLILAGCFPAEDMWGPE